MTALLTAQDVAARWRVDERTVQQLAARRLLRGFKVGRVWRFSEADVDAYLAHQANRVAAEQSSSATTVDYSDAYRDLWGGQP